MPKKQKEIKIVMHIPEDQASLDALQEKTNRFFAGLVEKKLRNTDLTMDEKLYVVKEIAKLYGSS